MMLGNRMPEKPTHKVDLAHFEELKQLPAEEVSTYLGVFAHVARKMGIKSGDWAATIGTTHAHPDSIEYLFARAGMNVDFYEDMVPEYFHTVVSPGFRRGIGDAAGNIRFGGGLFPPDAIKPYKLLFFENVVEELSDDSVSRIPEFADKMGAAVVVESGYQLDVYLPRYHQMTVLDRLERAFKSRPEMEYESERFMSVERKSRLGGKTNYYVFYLKPRHNAEK